ncbi:MAG TPA: MBL fold metallo-hydrolase [Vicinamibacterales bacterium]
MPGATVLFLGTGDAFCSGGRLHTAFHLTAGGMQALVDCGATTIAVMRHLKMDLAALDAILVSHLHGDHFGGIPFLLLDACHNVTRSKPLTIAGPAGLKLRVMDTLGCLYPGAPSVVEERLSLKFVEYKEREPARIGVLQVLPVPVVHPSGSTAYGLRIEAGGRVLAFSGDTAWTPALAEIARDADLFICECTFYDTPHPSHLHYTQLRGALDELGARRTVLTHLGPEMLQRLQDVDIHVPEDGDVIEL